MKAGLNPPGHPLKYRPDVDGLRAVAVVAVLLFHAAPGFLPGGFLGVDVFFVISGFLITGIIRDELREGCFTISGFYLRRARRILPALLVMLLVVSLIAALVLLPDEFERFAASLAASLLFVPNILLWREAGYFDVESLAKPLLHLWSLGVEEQFYLLWPLLFLLLARGLKARGLTAAIALLACASLAWQGWALRDAPVAAFFLPFGRFWELMTGALLAVRVRAPAEESGRSRPSFRDALSVAGFALVCVPFALSNGPGGAIFPVALAPVAGTAMIIAAGAGAWLNRTLLSNRAVVFVGLISYPLYLWHWPLLSFLHIADLESPWLDGVLRVAALLIAVAAAIATYWYVELPVRRRRDLRPVAMGVGALAAVAAAGIAFTMSYEWPDRARFAASPFVMTLSMRLQPQCLDTHMPGLRSRTDVYCLRSDFSRTPRVLLLGDSHANALWPGVVAGFPRESVLELGAAGCPYLRNAAYWDGNSQARRDACPGPIGAAYGAVPDARIVILAVRSGLYEPLPTFEKALELDLAYLLADQREVVIVQPPPELGFSPRRCVRMRPFEMLLGLRSRTACSLPREAVETRQAAFRAMIARVAARFPTPRLHVVDPMDALCDAVRCQAMIDGNVMYRDDNHLSAEGSVFVWSRISPFHD